MNRVFTLAFYFTLLLTVPRICTAVEQNQQSLNYSIYHLDNIPQNDVNCVFNDSKGFMWIGTLDGLHRYDGYQFKTYRINPSKNSISSNLIIDLDEDSKGNIWIGTYGKGICKLDPHTDLFSRYNRYSGEQNKQLPNDVSDMLVDDQDFLWICNWFGITRVRFDSTMNTVIDIASFPIQTEIDGQKHEVKSIFQDEQKNIWIGTNIFTMRVINPHAAEEQVTFERFAAPGIAICNYKNGVITGGLQVNTITADPKNGTYTATQILDAYCEKVLFRDNTLWLGNRSGTYAYKKSDAGRWSLAQNFSRNLLDQSLSSNIITSLTDDSYGQIWIGTRGGGINIIKLSSNRFQRYRHTLAKGSLSNDLTHAVFEDSYENLWIGTEEGGVNLLPKGGNYSNGFTQITINSYRNEDRVYAIEEISTPKSAKQKSLIWFGSSFPKFLAAINPATLNEINLGTLPRRIGYVFALEAEDDSTLWVGTYSKGLWRLNLDRDGNIKKADNFTPKSDAGSKVLSFIIRNIFKDQNGNIWIGTDKGVNRIPSGETDKAHPAIQSFTLGNDAQHLSHDYILQITESKDGTIWLGSMGGGLIRCNETEKGTFRFSTISTLDGLPNNTIKTIIEDQDGYLWLASNKGLTKYNPIDGNIVNYDETDGLQNNEFSEICGIRRKNGEIVFGGIEGFNVFRTGDIQIDLIKPQLYFTDFYILNKQINAGDTLDRKQILNQTIEFTKSITLDYKYNSFSIGFVGIQFNSATQNNYRYKLEGFDQEWYKASSDYRLAKYTNIPEGEYTFKVMCSNSDNIWTDQPIELKIKIKPPIYRSTWAFIAYIILFLASVITTYRIVRIINQRKRDVLISRMEKERVEEISKLRLQFFTNISHEFRTPLSLITAPLEQLAKEIEKQLSANQSYSLNLIKHNVGVMTRLIDQLLDFRKLDQSKVQLKPSKQSLNLFLENIFNAFTALANQRKIAYQFIPVSGDDEIWIDVDKMEKVIYNLLSNAFKYTNESGKIELKALAVPEEQRYLITVSDNGLGINEDEKEHIFERYYQAKNKSKQNISGTGIGLALSKGFVDLHEGEIGFYSNEPSGTVFFVKIRMGKSHFTEDILVEQPIKNTSGVPEYQSPQLNPEEEKQKGKLQNLPKLLIVEDNYDLRKQIKNLFRNEFQVFEAEDGLIGLELCNNEPPDIIITDLMMPNMDGLEMCKAIKDDENTSHIPILILTAKSSEDTQVEGYNIGADSYLPKPFSTEVLKASIFSLIKNREQLKKRFQKEIEIKPDIISNTPADAKFLGKILNIIKDNISEAEYSVEQLAADYGVSRIYLNRKIKALTGETTIEFIRNIKLKYAADLLMQNKLTVSEVAWEIGYNDIRTFRKRFKEKFDETPSEFSKKFL